MILKKGIHVGIIPDGNRRWASINKLPTSEGHKQGAEKMELFVNWAISKPRIKEISVYGLSEENFKRNDSELGNLYQIYFNKLEKLLTSKEIHDNEVKVNFVSTQPKKVPKNLADMFKELKNETKLYGNKVLNVMIGYTGQSEILSSVSSPMNRIKNLFFGLNEQDIQNHLAIPNVCDFIIRTGEEEAPREAKSGFLLWQSAYSEWYFSPILWPDFDRDQLKKAIIEFGNRERRFGGRKNKDSDKSYAG